MSAIEFLPLLLWYIISGTPAFLILRRTGLSAWWALFIVIPIFGAVTVLWVVAFRQWPGTARGPTVSRLADASTMADDTAAG
jgi:hypothetical protein